MDCERCGWYWLEECHLQCEEEQEEEECLMEEKP